jgi:ribosomal protein S27AE
MTPLDPPKSERLHVEKGTLIPGVCPSCHAVVSWDADKMTCGSCGLTGESDLFTDVEWRLKREQ